MRRVGIEPTTSTTQDERRTLPLSYLRIMETLGGRTQPSLRQSGAHHRARFPN